MASLTPDQLDRLAISLRAGEYNLLIGAGISLGSIGGDAEDLPTGEELRQQLCSLKSAKSNASLQRVYGLLSESEISTLITKRFSNTIPGPAVRKLPTFAWRRIFTLNIDDAVENSYREIASMQDLVSLNYKDIFQENRDLGSVPIIHLHGYAKRPDDGYVFSRSAYVDQVARGSSWMTILADLMAVEPFIIIGTALDEPDLDYYLARRNSASGRSDKGPGIFVEPFPDSITSNDCEKHNLVLFNDTADNFFNYLNETVKNRVSPVDLITQAASDLFPPNVGKIEQAKFLADFELVPGHLQVASTDLRFLLGHEPSWSDLESRLDVSREISGDLADTIRRIISSASKKSPKFVYYLDEVGGGKSTIIRRVSFDLARSGIRVMMCSTLGRIEPGFTSSMIDLIDGPLVIVVDNFADQVGPIVDVADTLEKSDIVFLCTERSYRARYLKRFLSGMNVTEKTAIPLLELEVRQLIAAYLASGILGNATIKNNPEFFASKLKGEAIAVVCCRILNDFQPMDRIVKSILEEATKYDIDRYLASALAQFCINGGIRYDILVSVSGANGIREQLQPHMSLPLTYSEEFHKNYVVPLNGVIGSRVLEYCSKDNPNGILDLFCRLGRALAPRVNRETIKKRTPEARFAGRLFDFDQVVEHFLGPLSEQFYSSVQREWQWNSRYWEQVSLLNLGKYYNNTISGSHYLEAASQHARHAVSLEHHPFPLTTLGKVLLAEFAASNFTKRSVFDEAIVRLGQAIDLERKWNWNSSQAYMITFKGALEAVSNGLSLTSVQAEDLATHMRFVKRRFGRDRELQEARATLNEVLSG